MNSASLTLNFSDKRWTAWDTRSTTHDESFFQMWSRHSDDAVVAMCDDGGHVQGWTYKVLELFCSHHCRSRKPEFGFAGFNTVLERQVHFLYFQLWICEFSCGEVALGKEPVQIADVGRLAFDILLVACLCPHTHNNIQSPITPLGSPESSREGS